MTEYEPYPAADDDLPWELGGPRPEPDGGGDENWCVLAEVAAGARSNPPSRIVVLAEGLPTREAALAEARTQAFEFRPPDPAFPQLRQVFEDDEGFLTILEGAMMTFHFRTRVMKLAGVTEG